MTAEEFLILRRVAIPCLCMEECTWHMYLRTRGGSSIKNLGCKAANTDQILLHLCGNYTLLFPSGTEIQRIPEVNMKCTDLAAGHTSSPRWFPLPIVSQLAIVSVSLFPRVQDTNTKRHNHSIHTKSYFVRANQAASKISK